MRQHSCCRACCWFPGAPRHKQESPVQQTVAQLEAQLAAASRQMQCAMSMQRYLQQAEQQCKQELLEGEAQVRYLRDTIAKAQDELQQVSSRLGQQRHAGSAAACLRPGCIEPGIPTAHTLPRAHCICRSRTGSPRTRQAGLRQSRQWRLQSSSSQQEGRNGPPCSGGWHNNAACWLRRAHGSRSQRCAGLLCLAPAQQRSGCRRLQEWGCRWCSSRRLC